MWFCDRKQMFEFLENRIQDYKKKKLFDFFLFCNKIISKPSLKSEKETISPAPPQALGGDGRRRKLSLDGAAYL